MKKTTTLTLLQSLNKVKGRSFRRFMLLALSQSNLRTFLTLFWKANSLSLSRITRLKDRIRVTHNFLQYLLKFKKNHGDEATIKWLKSCSVALQKACGEDRMKSLRELEPNLPLPRLINGFPAYINKRDRALIRSGHGGVTRFWLTQFNLYRILLGPYKTKLNTIYDPFRGKMSVLLSKIEESKTSNLIFKRAMSKDLPLLKGPIGLVLSHKASPSNSISYFGLLSDYHLMKKSSSYEDLISYLNVMDKSKFSPRPSTANFRSILSSLQSLCENVEEEGLKLPFKKAMVGTGLSQLAIKKESAGKVRVFAILDSLTQSALRPLHDFLFDILRSLPNDGTFDQDAAIKRASEKMLRYGVAYSYDLSSATDRIPARLTASIIESLTRIDGIGEAWLNLLVNRDYSFNTSVKKEFPNLLTDKDNKYRYSVGQPMGGLSSWAGLAITHHWILQNVSKSFDWEDRYEVLGDDIVIFDKDLAKSYLEVMEGLGVDINLSKSISASTSGFEFAKRTFMKGINVSSISLQQIASQTGISSRVADCVSWMKSGLIVSASHLGSLLSNKTSPSSFRKLNEVGLAALNTLSVLNSNKLVERRVVIESLINPRIEDFDWEQAKFDLPLRSILKFVLDICSGKSPDYPFSKESDRTEIWQELEPFMVDAMLQEALAKAKRLSRDFDHLTNKGAAKLVVGTPSRVLRAQLNGFFQELAMGFSSFDPGSWVDSIEDKLYFHAKSRLVPYDEAEKILDQVDAEIFSYTFKAEVSRVNYNKITSPVLTALRKSQGLVRIPYWQHGSI